LRPLGRQSCRLRLVVRSSSFQLPSIRTVPRQPMLLDQSRSFGLSSMRCSNSRITSFQSKLFVLVADH
jgi:hypothetical protein